MKVVVNQVYTAVGCNRTPEIVDWNREGLISFGATNAVVIYDINERCKDPITVLSHHRSLVNTVRWLYKQDGSCTELVSCSADKTAAIWTLVDGTWKVTSILTGHTDEITCVYGIYHEDKLLIYTGCNDSTINIWERSKDSTKLKHTIQLHSSLCLTLRAHVIPSADKPILFCGLDDHKIHLFAGDEYHRVHTLLGHEDWVRGLDVLEIDSNTILVASGSQDSYIRLWRISLQLEVERPATGIIAVEQKLFAAFGRQWSVKLEAVLGGHEGWIYGIEWYWPTIEGGKRIPVYRLLSSSLDKTLIIWEPDPSTGVWTERVRLGEVAGNALGFYGSRFGPNMEVLGHGYNGTFHVWTLDQESNEWKSAVVCGGHHGPVEDVRWEPHKGRYIVSGAADETSRVHAPWNRPDGLVEWHELARPQQNGYGILSLALVSSRMFASAAEEKVIRVFTAPMNFHENYETITGQVLVEGVTLGPQGATQPPLGLSNKAVFIGDQNTITNDGETLNFIPVKLTEPPTEEVLVVSTLWPEHQKLYGHGYEMFALAASSDGMLLASSCKATEQEHAAVLLWETKSCTQIQRLVYHQLTVTQVEFSGDSRRLVSVSRDRRWCLYQRRQDSNLFDKVACTDKTNGIHARIIWCCAWAPDGMYFGTGSRDGKVCIWTNVDITPASPDSSLGAYGLCGNVLELSSSSVTALAFAPILFDGASITAVGLESGVVRLYAFDGIWTLIHIMDTSAAHHLAVKRLAFKPQKLDVKNQQALLASCGSDRLVRIHCITVL